jgi:hypothetical protein
VHELVFNKVSGGFRFPYTSSRIFPQEIKI